MTIRIAFIIVAGAFVWAAQSSVGAQGSVNAGVYSAAQAKRGAAAYASNCAACHGADLGGGDPVPSLAGEKFLANWKTVGDLYQKISTTMPSYAPGSVPPKDVADIVAEILRVNKFPAGSTELAANGEALKAIRIEPAK